MRIMEEERQEKLKEFCEYDDSKDEDFEFSQNYQKIKKNKKISEDEDEESEDETEIDEEAEEFSWNQQKKFQKNTRSRKKRNFSQ